MQKNNNLVQDSKAAILAALEEIGSVHGAELVSIWPFTQSQTGTSIERRYCWQKTSSTLSKPQQNNNIAILKNKTLRENLKSNIPTAGSAPPHAEIRDIISPEAQSYIIVPIMLHQNLWGIIICEFAHNEQLTANALSILMESGVHIAAVLQRKLDIQRMSQAYDEYRLLLKRPPTKFTFEDSSRHLLEQLPEGIFTLSTERAITYFSPFFERIAGFSQEALQEQIIRNMPIIEQERATTNDAPLFFTVTTKNTDGTPIIFEIHCSALHDVDGSHNGYICIARDITEQHLEKQEQKRTQKSYRHLLEHISDVICRFDNQGIITFISDAVLQASGYTPDEIIGNPLTHFIHPDFFLPWKKHLADLCQAQSEIFECRLSHKDGSFHWIRLKSRPVFDEEGMLKEIVTVMVNIDAYKKIEKNFQESETAENVYQQIIEQMPSLVWVVDTQLITTYVSPSINQVLGYTQDEAMSMEMGLILKRDSFKHMLEAFDEALSAATAKDKTWFKDLEIWQKRANGRIIKGSLRMSLLFKDNEHIGILGITTMRKKAGQR